MNWDALAILSWAIFLFAWLPVKCMRHRNRMRSIQAINKGHSFSKKYKYIRKLTRRAA